MSYGTHLSARRARIRTTAQRMLKVELITIPGRPVTLLIRRRAIDVPPASATTRWRYASRAAADRGRFAYAADRGRLLIRGSSDDRGKHVLYHFDSGARGRAHVHDLARLNPSAGLVAPTRTSRSVCCEEISASRVTFDAGERNGCLREPSTSTGMRSGGDTNGKRCRHCDVHRATLARPIIWSRPG